MKTPEITVVVCTHNRAIYLEECIDALLQQSVPSEIYDILVVDNGSTDNTKDICAKFVELKNFHYIFEPVLGLSHARNCGWKNAAGKYIGYIDDDATADKNWVEKALESFENSPEPDWVGGSVTLRWEEEPPTWLTEEYYGALGWVNWGESPKYIDPDTEWLVGCNSFFKKDSLAAIGGFDMRLGRKKENLLSGEEVQLHHRLRAAGGNFFYHPEVHVYHHAAKKRTRPSYFYRRYYWGGITDFVMSKTLKDVPAQMDSSPQDEQSKLVRLTCNLLQSFGLFVSKEKTIKSRIYMSYVLGQLVAVCKYGWRNLEVG